MFAQSPANHPLKGPFIIVSTVESTNNYAMAKLHAGLVESGSCFLAIEQTAGKGQRGKTWIAQPGKNITMTTVLTAQKRTESAAEQAAADMLGRFPFILSAATALGCYDFIKGFGVTDLFIKWPNDLYIGDRKAAGILIENVYAGNRWAGAVAGTGVNLNQAVFPDEVANAISIRQAVGSESDLVQMGRLLHRCLLERYASLEVMAASALMDEYNSRLYRRGSEVRLKSGSVTFATTLVKVLLTGELVTRDTLERSFSVGEVVFV